MEIKYKNIIQKTRKIICIVGILLLISAFIFFSFGYSSVKFNKNIPLTSQMSLQSGTNPLSTGTILRDPVENDDYYQKTVKDMSSLKYDEFENKSIIATNINPQYRTKTTNTLTKSINIKISYTFNFWQAYAGWNTYYSSQYLQYINLEAKTRLGKTINKSFLISNTLRLWHSWGEETISSAPQILNVTWYLPNNFDFGDSISSIDIKYKTYRTETKDDGSFQLKIKNVSIITGQKTLVDSNDQRSIDIPYKTPTYSSKFSYPFDSSIYVGPSEVSEDVNWKVKKVIFTDNFFKANHNQYELKQYIKIYDTRTNNILFNENQMNFVYIDQTRKYIRVDFKTSEIWVDSKHYYKITASNPYLIIPIRIINTEKIVTPSLMSSTYWHHSLNGETKYHTSPPTTSMKLSENYLKALYYQSYKSQLLLDIEKWDFAGNDKSIAVQKIRDYSLNQENKEDIKSAYEKLHNQSILSNLSPSLELTEYLKSFDSTSIHINDYLYYFKNNNISLSIKFVYSHDYSFAFKEFNSKATFSVPSADSRTNKAIIVWRPLIYDVYLGDGFSTTIDMPKGDLSKIYDRQIGYDDPSLKSIYHKYLYQLEGIDISSNISLVLEDGTTLDKDFIVKTSPGKSMTVGSKGYIGIRALIERNNGVQEYINIERKSNRWWSSKYGSFVEDLDSSFDEELVQYVFNQDIQLLINPYASSSGTVSVTTPQLFGLGSIIDTLNGIPRTLEDWEDGRWSHAQTASGTGALFDGIFGSDLGGIFDSKGHLSSGTHKIHINLKNSATKGLRKDFTIVVDKIPAKAKVTSNEEALEKILIKDNENEIKELYFSSGAISFDIADDDLESVEAQVIDENGKWYKIPIEIKSKKIEGRWVQTIHSTVDFAGFAHVTIKDGAGNVNELLFWLKQGDGVYKPNIFFPETNFNSNLEYLSEKMPFFEDGTNLKIFSPLVTGLEFYKANKVDGSLKFTEVLNGVQDTSSLTTTEKHFGRTIDSTKDTLRFAGDELKEFHLVQSSDPSWTVIKKQIPIPDDGLYKLVVSTRLVDMPKYDQYFYVKQGEIIPYDESQFDHEKSNLKEVPNVNTGESPSIDGKAVEDLDNYLSKELNFDLYDFEAKSIKVMYSQMWYSTFIEFEYSIGDALPEGKYWFTITDIKDEVHELKLLVLDKTKSREKDKFGITMIMKIKDDESTAFWKGKNLWNYWRYEDEDHVVWEKDNFINEAMANGLTKEEAEALYKALKENPSFNGDINYLKQSEFNFTEELAKAKDTSPEIFQYVGTETLPTQNEFKDTTEKNISKKTGIILGATLGTLVFCSLVAFAVYKRIKGKKIK